MINYFCLNTECPEDRFAHSYRRFGCQLLSFLYPAMNHKPGVQSTKIELELDQELAQIDKFLLKLTLIKLLDYQKYDYDRQTYPFKQLINYSLLDHLINQIQLQSQALYFLIIECFESESYAPSLNNSDNEYPQLEDPFLIRISLIDLPETVLTRIFKNFVSIRHKIELEIQDQQISILEKQIYEFIPLTQGLLITGYGELEINLQFCQKFTHLVSIEIFKCSYNRADLLKPLKALQNLRRIIFRQSHVCLDLRYVPQIEELFIESTDFRQDLQNIDLLINLFRFEYTNGEYHRRLDALEQILGFVQLKVLNLNYVPPLVELYFMRKNISRLKNLEKLSLDFGRNEENMLVIPLWSFNSLKYLKISTHIHFNTRTKLIESINACQNLQELNLGLVYNYHSGVPKGWMDQIFGIGQLSKLIQHRNLRILRVYMSDLPMRFLRQFGRFMQIIDKEIIFQLENKRKHFRLHSSNIAQERSGL